MGWVWDGMGMGWKSLRGVILRAPLCGANKGIGDAGSTADLKQRWKNAQILQIYLCYSFWAVLIFFGCIRANKLKHCAISTVLKAIC